MSARDDIIAMAVETGQNPHQSRRAAERLLDQYAHELAEEIRKDAGPIPPGFWQDGGGPSPDQAGMYHAADLIDPDKQ